MLKPDHPILTAILVLGLTLLMAVVARSQVIEAKGIDRGYCQGIFEKVQQAASWRSRGPVRVVVIDTPVVLSEHLKVTAIGVWEQDIRTVTINRQFLCPWILAHELAHACYGDTWYFHPESWADVTATKAVGEAPEWLGLNK